METKLEVVEEEETQLVYTLTSTLQTLPPLRTAEDEEQETQFVNTLTSMLQNLPPFRTEVCIYRIPYELRHVNERAYTPMRVSIGPFHHGKERLPEMEVHKQRYLNDFLNRRPDLDLEHYVRLLKEFEERARNCYAENIHYSSNDFIKMMLLDGCFIVEFFLKYWRWRETLGNNDNVDPIFKSHVMLGGLQRDMTLLENQLPFFILEHLFNSTVEFGFKRGISFLEIALNIMDGFIRKGEKWIELGETTYQAKHIVDLCVQYYTPTATGTELSPKTAGGIFCIPQKKREKRRKSVPSISNASRLHESGVKFTKCTCSSEKCLLHVKFTNGNLEISSVVFASNTETILRNCIAYEQCDIGNTQFFTVYTHLMDCLIDTLNDVELLMKAEIINNLRGDNAEVAQIFNKLSRGAALIPNIYLRRLCEDVNDYSNIRWHAWKAKLQRNCFNTPWRSLSVVTAVILLILTFMQSVCSILQLKG